MLKSWKPFHYQQKLSSNLLSKFRGCFLTPKTEKTQKMTKIVKTIEKKLCEN